MITNHRPNVAAMSREELLAYGDRGHRESMTVSLELIRRSRERRPELWATNVVRFPRKDEEEGEPA